MLSTFERIAVVGATGAVGTEALAILSERGIPASRIVALASVRSVSSRLPYGSEGVMVQEAREDAFEGVDAAIFCATSGVSKALIPAALRAGALVVDNSSAFRMDPKVPLVVPEVNGHLIKGDGPRLIANPNCSTIIMLVALEPLRRAFGVERVVVSTYQAVSGAGAAAMQELKDQASDVLAGRSARPRIFAEQCAFNVFSHNSAVDVATGINVEERKLIDESRKIWNQPSLLVSPTCVRVPVLRAHTESITVTLAKPATEAQVRQALLGGAGIEIIDDRAANRFPTPLQASGKDDVHIGRIRPDPGTPLEADGRSRAWSLLACGDQIRKGAALNAIQIADIAGSPKPTLRA